MLESGGLGAGDGRWRDLCSRSRSVLFLKLGDLEVHHSVVGILRFVGAVLAYEVLALGPCRDPVVGSPEDLHADVTHEPREAPRCVSVGGLRFLLQHSENGPGRPIERLQCYLKLHYGDPLAEARRLLGEAHNVVQKAHGQRLLPPHHAPGSGGDPWPLGQAQASRSHSRHEALRRPQQEKRNKGDERFFQVHFSSHQRSQREVTDSFGLRQRVVQKP